MKYLAYIFFTSIFLFYNNVYAIVQLVDIRLTFVSNNYNTPSLGIATLVIDVEAKSTVSDTYINAFQDAIQADANLQLRIISVNFSNELFISSNYNTSENFNSPDIQFTYTYNSGAKSQILSSVWSRVVTITIQYNMINQLGSVIWSTVAPNFYVTDGSNIVITGTEQPIPASLTNFALPVELSSFTASINQNSVNLKWQTKTEVENYGFDVERKNGNGELLEGSWERLGFVPGHGNSNSPKEYSFVDKNPAGGSKFIYRLKQIDNNGKLNYSDQVEIQLLPNNFALYQNYPNPFNPVTEIKFAVPKASKINLVVYNILGEKIQDLAVGFYEPGIYNVSFDGKDFTSGTYIYRMQTESAAGGFVQIKKMLLVR